METPKRIRLMQDMWAKPEHGLTVGRVLDVVRIKYDPVWGERSFVVLTDKGIEWGVLKRECEVVD